MPQADALVMAAAVANYMPEQMATQKIAHDDGALSVRLAPTPDILADVVAWRGREGRTTPLLVGFAAETQDVVERARAKRLRKGIDVIVANDVSKSDSGFDVDANAVTIIGEHGDEAVPRASKAAIAAVLARPLGAVAGPSGRPSPSMSTARDLAAHLRYLNDLGVNGVSSDPSWRVRRTAPDAPGAPEGPEAPEER